MTRHFTPYLRYVLAVLTAAALFITAAGLSPAAAADDPPIAAIDAAQTVATTVEDKTVISETDAGAVGLTLPGRLVDQAQVSLAEIPKEYLEATDSTPLVSTKLPHGAISSYETDSGTQTLIRIESAQASREYRFPLGLQEGAKAELIEKGSILIKDAGGKILGGYDVPWAIDAKGTQIPTQFRIEDDTLIQTIYFTPETAFPVVADPNSWWGWVQCSAAIGFLVATNSLAAVRIAKIGGVAKLISRLQKLKSSEKILAELIGFFGEVFAIDNVINKCK